MTRASITMRTTRILTPALALAYLLAAAPYLRPTNASAAAAYGGGACPQVSTTCDDAGQQYHARNVSPGRRPLFVASNVASVAAFPVSPRATAAAAQTLEEVKVTLKPTGFEPAEVIRAAGPFRLRVVNASGEEGLTFRLIKATGQEVFRSAPAAGSSDWSGGLDLPAGRYVFTEVNHPEWALNISVL